MACKDFRYFPLFPNFTGKLQNVREFVLSGHKSVSGEFIRAKNGLNANSTIGPSDSPWFLYFTLNGLLDRVRSKHVGFHS